MSIFRLLPFSLLIAVGLATAAAQSSPGNTTTTVPSGGFGKLNSSESNLLSSNLKSDLSPPNPLDRIHVDQYRPQLSQFAPPRMLLNGPDPQMLGDNVCYSMRSYKVARDDPHSDSTHAAGYSTCQPSARFHVHTIEGRASPEKP
jgi:hypothetical protein